MLVAPRWQPVQTQLKGCKKFYMWMLQTLYITESFKVLVLHRECPWSPMDRIKAFKWSPEFNGKETLAWWWSNPALSCFQQLNPHNPALKRNLLPSTSRKRLETLYTTQISKSRNSLLPFTVLHSWENQFLGKLVRSPGSLRRRKGSWAPEEETGIWSSQGREMDNFCFSLSLELMIVKQNNSSCSRICFSLNSVPMII